MSRNNNLWRHSAAESISTAPLAGDHQCDLVVIGGGYTGTSAALSAAEQGASVCLLEARDIGYGGSGRNVGLVNAGLWLPPETICRQMGAAPGRKLIDDLGQAPDRVFGLIDKHAIDCEATRNGTLHNAHNAAGMRDITERHRQLLATDAPVTLLDADEARARNGSTRVFGALHDARAGTIQPRAYCLGLARAAQQAGAQLHESSPAQMIRHDGAQWIVKTPGGVVRARALIQATNGYHLGNTGAPMPQYVPIWFSQLATKPLPEALRRDILAGGEGCWDTALVMNSWRLDLAGRLIIGAMGDISHAAGGLHRGYLRRKLAALYPQLADQPLDYGWSGRIAMTSDHIPKTVELGPRGLSTFGYSGRGIGPGTSFGIAMARAVLEGDNSKLPLPVIKAHREHFPGLRAIYYETGATLMHSLPAG
jgi:L-pipecolate oxidase